MIIQRTFNAAAQAATHGGLAYTAEGSSPIGGAGTLPISEAPGPSTTAGLSALLIVNTGASAVSCVWWLAANGPVPLTGSNFVIPSGGSVVKPIPAFGPDTLAFFTPDGVASIGIVAGAIVTSVDLGPVDLLPAPVGT